VSRGASSLPESLSRHFVPFALVALAAVPGLRGDLVFMACLLAVAGLSVYFTRRRMQQIRAAGELKERLDRQLIQAQKLASIGELSSGIAHEINNPLAVIAREVEWVQSILKDEDLSERKSLDDIEDSLREINRQVDRCQEITYKLLDFARKQEPLLQSLNVNALMEDMVKLVEKVTTKKKVRFVRDYREDLPLLHTDGPLLRQVFLNLLNNAVYAVEDQGTVAVATRLEDDGRVTVTVSDDGCGIPPENLNRVFDPFFTTKPQGKGTGLGLSLCHGIVSKLGGTLSAASRTGEGATFTVRLPLEQGASPP